MRFIELKKYEDIDYSLLYREGITMTPFVCAWNPTYDDKGCVIRWSQGHYFESIDDAVEYMNGLDIKKDNNIDNIYEYYNKLIPFQKDNLRLFSCFKAAEDNLRHDFSNRDYYVMEIGLLAYQKWLNTNQTDYSCEDIALIVAEAMSDNLLNFDDLKLLDSDELVLRCRNYDFSNISHMPSIVSVSDYNESQWRNMLDYYDYIILESKKSYDPEGTTSDLSVSDIKYAGTLDEIKNTFSNIKNNLDPDVVQIIQDKGDFFEVYYPNAILKVNYELLKNPFKFDHLQIMNNRGKKVNDNEPVK